MKKKIIKVILFVIGGIIVLLGAIFVIAWKSPKYYVTSGIFSDEHPIVLFKYYDTVTDHPRPYLIERSNLVVFGATHTRDPKDSQIKLIGDKWKQLKPTVALVEGRMGFLLPGLMDPVETLGENGKVKELAEEDDIPVYNWDLSKEELAKKLSAFFTAEQIALAQILYPYFSALRHGKPASPENVVQEFIGRASYVNQQDNFKSVADIDRVWKKHFPDGKDWRETSDEYGLPGYLGQYMSLSNDLRNYQLVSAIKELQQKGERPFVICGSSHSYCIAPAIP